MGDMVGAIANIFQGRKSAHDAATLEQSLAMLGLGEQKREFNIGQKDTAPWRSAGEAALYNLEDLAGMSSPTSYTDAATGKTVTRAPMTATTALTSDPGYKVRLDALNQALMRGGMGTQTYGSGNFWDSVMKANQDYASNEYTNLYNRLAGIAGTGQQSAGQSASLATTTGSNIGSSLSSLGVDLAQIMQNQNTNSMYANNQLGSGFNNAVNNYAYLKMLKGGGGGGGESWWGGDTPPSD